MTELSYEEIREETLQYKKIRPENTTITTKHIKPHTPIQIQDIYPTICKALEKANIHSRTRGIQRWIWHDFTQHLCKKYNTTWKDYDDGCRRFILHSDGSYTEVTKK